VSYGYTWIRRISREKSSKTPIIEGFVWKYLQQSIIFHKDNLTYRAV